MGARKQPERLALKDLVGQEKVRAGIRGVIAAARKRKEFLDHILLVGDHGMGKATIADALAVDCGTVLHAPSEEQAQDPQKFFRFVANMRPGELLLLEGFPDMPKRIRDMVAACMQGGPVRIKLGHGDTAQIFTESFPRVTVIATAERASKQLRDMFAGSFLFELQRYSLQNIQEVVMLAAARDGVSLDNRAATLIAKASDGSPADAVPIFRRVCRLAQVAAGGVLSGGEVKRQLELLVRIQNPE